MLTVRDIGEISCQMRNSGVPSALVRAAFEATIRYDQTQKQLAEKVEGLAQQLADCLAALRNGTFPTNLNVCQEATLDVHRLCVELSVVRAMALEVQEHAQGADLLPLSDAQLEKLEREDMEADRKLGIVE